MPTTLDRVRLLAQRVDDIQAKQASGPWARYAPRRALVEATAALVDALRALANELLAAGHVEMAEAVARHLAEGDAKSAVDAVTKAFPVARD